jgi:hypothetical protein
VDIESGELVGGVYVVICFGWVGAEPILLSSLSRDALTCRMMHASTLMLPLPEFDY